MKKMKLTLFSAVLFALSGMVSAQSVQLVPALPAPGGAPAGSPVAKHGRLSISGNKMVSQHGHEVQLKGMSFFWGNSGAEGRPFYNDAVVGWMTHDWKVDVLRAAIGPANDPQNTSAPFTYVGAGYIDGDEAGQWNNVVTVVEGAIRRGIYVIVDWHSHKATTYTTQSAAFFTRVVQAYGRYPNLIYEIYNEPCNQANRCSNESWDQIRNYSNTVVSAIRTAETSLGAGTHNNVVIIGTRGFSSLENPGEINSSPVTGTNLAYSLHFYNDQWHWDNFWGRAETILSANRAVFVSEFGISTSDGGGSVNTDRGNQWLTRLNGAKVSWVNWSITNKNESSAALVPSAGTNGGWTTAQLSTSGNWVRNILRNGASTTLNVNSNGITDTTYTITIANSEGGTVTRNPSSARYNYGTQVVLTATPAEGYQFVSWSGDLRGSSTNTFTATVRGINLNIGAVFSAGGANLIKNGSFAGNTSVDWTVTNQAQSTGAIVSPVTNNELTLNFTGANIGTATGAPFLNQRNIALTAGRRYRLSFDARAAQTRNISVTVCNGDSRTTRFLTAPGSASASTLSLTQTNQNYWAEFDVGQNLTNGQVEFWFGGQNINWFLTNVMLTEIGPASGATVTSWNNVSVLQNAPAASKTVWSVNRTGSGLQLSGPAVSGEARVSLYDVRGRLVKAVSLTDGKPLTLNTSVAPAGNYLLVVRNNLGKEVYKTRVLLAK